MLIFNKIIGSGKYTSNGMTCPHCLANKAKFVEILNFGVSRWRCGACKGTWRYLKTDAPPPDYRDVKKDPSLLVGGPAIMKQHVPLVKRIMKPTPKGRQ